MSEPSSGRWRRVLEAVRTGGLSERVQECPHRWRAVSFRNYCYCPDCGEKREWWKDGACSAAFEDRTKHMRWEDVPGESRN